MSAEARLKELGLVLPKLPKPVANYLPYRLVGNVLYLAGQGPRDENGNSLTGKLGAGISVTANATATNGNTIQDLNGPFVNVNVGAGAGADVAVGGVLGSGATGNTVVGGSVAAGAGVGGGGSATVTNTVVTPNVNIWEILTGKKCR